MFSETLRKERDCSHRIFVHIWSALLCLTYSLISVWWVAPSWFKRETVASLSLSWSDFNHFCVDKGGPAKMCNNNLKFKQQPLGKQKSEWAGGSMWRSVDRRLTLFIAHRHYKKQMEILSIMGLMCQHVSSFKQVVLHTFCHAFFNFSVKHFYAKLLN